MKRDIRINIFVLEEIYRKVKIYIDALTQLEHASKDFEEAIKEQKSEAYEALSELWENNISQKESKIKWQLVIVADLLKDYINAMQEYMQPVNKTQNIRVDRDDIQWNLQQINNYIYNFNWIANDDSQSWNDYSRPFVYDKFEDEETNEARRRIQEVLESQERARRQNNYNTLAAFREELKKENNTSAYISTIYEEMCEIEKIYDNNIVPFENTDDLFAGKMKGYYDEWKSLTNTIEDFNEVVYSFGRGLRQVGLDTFEDAVHIGNLLYVQELKATGQEVPEELQADVDTYINNLRSGISNTITDPGNTIEAIGQNIFDTVDEEGLAYAAGYIAPEVAIALATKKMTDKGAKVKGGTGVADDVVESVLEGGTSAKGLIGHDFEDYLSKTIGGEGSFSVGGRDFDGGIGNRWWEAKSGNYWSMLEENPNKLAKFKSDMGDRLRIATENGATYEIFSNTPIPESIKQWLTKKGITFTELLD